MGDLHCASLHLKSRTHSTKYQAFALKNPHFEGDWEALRHKAFEKNQRQNQIDEAPPPPNISGIANPTAPEPPFIESIPLQINQKRDEDVAKHAKKSKNKKKKDKKKRKKKRSKRRSSSSSSSSSSSESSDTEATASPIAPPPVDNIDKTASIRVTMRNAAKVSSVASVTPTVLEEKSGGGWTVVQTPQPPAPLPPTISANGEAAKRKDDLLISQWNAPEPIITEKEKKLLEQLKGKLKSREESKNEKAREDRNASSKVDDRGRRRSSSRGRDRRDRRSRSPRRSPRRSRSPRNRRRSRSRSRSRGRRVEKPIVRYPEFRPRVPEPENEKSKKTYFKKEDKADKSHSPAPKKTSSTSKSLTKRLPFIGRMPVFKKQTAGLHFSYI